MCTQGACQYEEYDTPKIRAVIVLGTEKKPVGAGVRLTAAIFYTLVNLGGTGAPKSS